eukprot:GDKI01011452.1.p1 GENE.GDKI01011452.1~~GDKI01011452.1.p1  ORF type:complete len:294 (+),score=93.05 GDKI01011452.1:46-882(+)
MHTELLAECYHRLLSQHTTHTGDGLDDVYNSAAGGGKRTSGGGRRSRREADEGEAKSGVCMWREKCKRLADNMSGVYEARQWHLIRKAFDVRMQKVDAGNYFGVPCEKELRARAAEFARVLDTPSSAGDRLFHAALSAFLLRCVRVPGQLVRQRFGGRLGDCTGIIVLGWNSVVLEDDGRRDTSYRCLVVELGGRQVTGRVVEMCEWRVQGVSGKELDVSPYLLPNGAFRFPVLDEHFERYDARQRRFVCRSKPEEDAALRWLGGAGGGTGSAGHVLL